MRWHLRNATSALEPLCAFAIDLIQSNRFEPRQPAGFFCLSGTTWPEPCPAGTTSFPGAVSKQSCSPCPRGLYTNASGTSKCDRCPPGTYQNSTERTRCIPCPPGHWCSSGIKVACGQDLYTDAPFSNRTSLESCLSCPRNAIANFKVTLSMAGCLAACESNYFAKSLPLRSDPDQCAPCPPHASCGENTTLPTIKVLPHYWRPASNSTTARLCPNKDACTGGATSSALYNLSDAATCAPNRSLTGAYCALCVDPTSHYLDATAGRCQPCDTAQTAASAVLTVLVLVALGAVCVHLRRHVAMHLERASFRAKARVVVSFFQIFSQVDVVYGLRFPPAYAALIDALSVINLRVFHWLPGIHPVCMGLPSLHAQLWFATFVPFGVALALCILKLPRVALWWTYLLFPSISSLGFRALAPCDCFPYVDGGEVCFLREDLSVQCSVPGSVGSAPSNILTAAWSAIVLWGVVIPLLLYPALMLTPSLRPSLGVLMGDYRPHACMWELVVVGEKLVLTGA